MKSFLRKLLATSLISLVICAAVGILANSKFVNSCEVYLVRAAQATNPEVAQNNLFLAMKYLANNNLTGGTIKNSSGSINNIGIWYDKLDALETELLMITPYSDQITRANVIAKTKDVLLSKSSSLVNTEIYHPVGISLYPYNTIYSIWVFVSLLFVFVILIILIPSDPWMRRC